MTKPASDDGVSSGLFERFELLGGLGSGGMGSVSLAYDSRLRARVALKSVGTVTGAALLRFKREFRAVKGLAHPNLVSLGELFEQDGQWFLSMEYIDGVSFLDYVRPPGLGAGEADSSHEASAVPVARLHDVTANASHSIGDDPSPTFADTYASEGSFVDGAIACGGNQGHRFDEGRLRHCLLQLVDATHTLHQTDRIHRDLKNSNVLVTAGGRVVVLDFGLIGEVERGIVRSTGVYGTPAYMAPEQAIGGDLSAAIDLYAIGVMLYEALCGRWPVIGSTLAILRAKQEPITIRPSEHTDQELPEDLEQLCMELLAIDPAARPDTAAVFERLGAEPPRPRRGVVVGSDSKDPCIGREPELERLAALFEDTRAKRARQVLILGEAGIGKTSLVREAVARFSAQIAAKPWVLYGRCHEHEQVRYKAFDSLIDRLSVELPRQMSSAELRALLPDDAWLLSRAFPVLQRVAAFAQLGLGPAAVGDRGELHRRMIIALRELFFRLAERSHLVLIIEDLQWADQASWALLEELTGDTRAPPLALVVTARAEIATSAPAAAPFLALAGLERIELGPLDLSSIEQFAALHLRDRASEDGPTLARHLQAATNGHPLYLGVLLRSATIDLDGHEPPSLGDCLLEQAAELGPDARQILEVLAVAERPLRPSAIASLTYLGGEQVSVSLDVLHGGQWIRSGGGADAGRVGVFHSQVRAAVLGWLEPSARRQIHLEIAVLLELYGSDLDHVVTHLLAADEREEAIVLAGRAAEQAMDALAFDRAADLYALALEHPFEDPEFARALAISRAHALAWSGRRMQAADVYLQAAEGAATQLDLQLRSKAAMYLLSSGEFVRGRALLEAIMHELGVSLPRSSGATIMALVRDTTMVRITSRRPRIDADTTLSFEHQLRLELCQASHWIYSIFDLLLTGYFSATYARLALRSRDRAKVASGMSHVAAFVSYMGDRAKADAMFREVQRLLEGVDAPLIRGTVAVHETIASLVPEFDCVDYARAAKRAVRLLQTAGAAERGDDFGVVIRSAAMMLARMVLAQALERCGDLRGLEALWRELTADARNLDSARSLQVWILVAAPFTAIHLARNRPALSLGAATRGLELLETDEFLVPHLVALISRMRSALYQGDAVAAVADFESHRVALRRSFTTRAPDLRADIAATEACARLALRATCRPEPRAERELGKAIRFLEQFPASFHRGRGQCCRAVLQAQGGDRAGAAASLTLALATFEKCRARGNAAAVKLMLPRLRDDQHARELRAEGLSFFLDADVHDPDRFAAMMLPDMPQLTAGPESNTG